MKSHCLAVLACLLAAPGVAQTRISQEGTSAWPAITQSAKPWTRWWWPGSAVQGDQITAQLQAMAAAGIGGVEITPIYGARDADARYLEFLSPRWVEMLAFAGHEAQRLGLGVDMATGTGWPFGGPTVVDADGSSSPALEEGRLTGKPTAMKVKRPAPGGEGLVLDPYSRAAMSRYLERFSTALAPLPRGTLRSQFHDSFEYYNASWSPQLPAAFLALNGYDIQAHAAEVMDASKADADTVGRIKGDYRRTLAKLHLDYLQTWIDWSHAHGFRARNQAHGAPGNLLDLYAAADIPETESFGATPLPIVGLHADAAGVSADADPPLNLIGRMASSAAHVAGHPLASSETLTWLRENFRESPSAAKPQIDRLFAAGINHIFYHGTVYSPADVTWPGWFFYAATQLNPNNPLWEDLGAMHAYVGRVQSVLQAGRPDNDILLYWPFDDLADDEHGLMRQLGMHENAWLVDSSMGRMALRLIEAGYSFDFVSDAQLKALRVERGAVVAPGGRYKLIMIPAVRRMSVETLAKLLALEEAGACLRFESLPVDVPGYGRLTERRAELKTLLAKHPPRGYVTNIDVQLQKLGLRQEPASAAGLTFIRRAREDGFDYFFANLGAAKFDGWLQLATPAAAAMLFDPLTGRTGVAASGRGPGGNARVYLQLASGESAIVRTLKVAPGMRGLAPWRYVRSNAAGVEIPGEWQLEFIKGGPALPANARLAALASWTTFDDVEARRFAGTARYRIEFDAPAQRAHEWMLDLGDVRETARVRLNGQTLPLAWSVPFMVRLGSALKAKGNVLEIEVTNLPANRIRDLDVRKVDWKIMKDINLASLRYRAFDASTWEPAPSGLLGPVRLVPLDEVIPK
ncbi:MAG TPA: glycosyl hydrolase [Steroidobacteraceae bacterium]|jgi:hypothetical protein|nr:glycosyl hydrolase [Steroidobacteraceae bacterium]